MMVKSETPSQEETDEQKCKRSKIRSFICLLIFALVIALTCILEYDRSIFVLPAASTEDVPTGCPLCGFAPPLAPVSTISDRVLIFSNNDHILGLITFVRSLRTTGCRAQIVLFGMSVPYKRESFLTVCGVVFEPFALKRLRCSYYYGSIRFFEMQRYLLKHDEVGRVLLSDADVVFQADPFIQPVGEDELVFSSEILLFRESKYNTRWIKKFTAKFGEHGEMPAEAYKDKEIINTGLIYGMRPTLIRYFGAYIQRFQNHSNSLTDFCGYGYDQAILNMFVYNNYFGDQIKFNVVSPKVANLSFPHYVWNEIKAQNKPFGQWRIPYDTDRYILVVHGWDKDPTMKAAVREKCPSIDRDDRTRLHTGIQ